MKKMPSGVPGGIFLPRAKEPRGTFNVAITTYSVMEPLDKFGTSSGSGR
jgi:hypothetical protein